MVPFVYACSFSWSNAPASPGIVIRDLGFMIVTNDYVAVIILQSKYIAVI